LTVALPKGGLAWKGVLKGVVQQKAGSESTDALTVALPMDGLALTVECSVPKVDWQKEHWVGSLRASGWRKDEPRRHHLHHRGHLVGRKPSLQPGPHSRLKRSESGRIVSLGFLLFTFLRDLLFLLADDGHFGNIGLQLPGDLAIG
jgi:hypothetical protein